MRQSSLHSIAIILVAMGFVACSSTANCDSSEVKGALAQSIKQMVGNEAQINYDSFEKIPLQDYAIEYKGVNQNTTFTCETETTINLHNEIIFRYIIEYAPQYDYDNKMYVKIIEPREIYSSYLSNLGYQVALARSYLTSARYAIAAKIFADNINAKQPKAPHPNNPNEMIEWGEWMYESS